MLVPMPPRQKPEESRAPGLAFPVVRLRVELVPPVWRRLQVPSNFTLRRLHVVLQHVMGWKQSPRHQFRVGSSLFGMASENSGALKDSRWATLQDLLAQKAKTFTYEYDAGTPWIHQVRIEGLDEGNATNQRPVCLAGAGACPPEDCGGLDAYVALLETDRMRGKLADLDPDAFDLDEINTTLASLRF